MRLLFINETHPDSRHVAGMRLNRFATALIERGHEVVQVTGPAPGHPSGTGTTHDVAPKLISLAAPVTREEKSAVMRRVNTALRLTRSDRATDEWLNLARGQTLGALGDFRPQLIWATFGNVYSLLLARRLAREWDCPWIIDAKDNWESFNRRGLRAIVARRFASAAGLTANSRLHRDIAKRYFPGSAVELVYSGVAEPFYRARQAGHQDPSGTRTLLLVGGTYRRAILDQYLGAIADWLQTLSATDQARFRLRYAGADHDVVTDAAAAKGLLAVADITPAITLDALADLVRTSFCATYLWSPHTFHHKLLELLVAGQAVVAFPGEHAESVEFAGQCDTPFAVARDRASLIEQLSLLWAAAPQSATRRAAPRWRWGDFADGLEAFFEAILSSKHSAGDKQRHEVER
jgi:glycosyltransferase involved in cell wall biosynthesis